MSDRVPVIYITADGRRYEIEARCGDTVMSTALEHQVPGILANCGGSAMCATCHVYVDQAFADRLPTMGDDEDGLLGFAASPRKPTSRLGCQLVITPQLEGLEVGIPDTQV